MSDAKGDVGALLFEIPVRASLDVFGVRHGVKACATSVGFDRTAASELVIASSELATNILKYGVSGRFTVRATRSTTFGDGVVLVAEDVGPPFHDFETALLDFHDDRGPLDVDERRSHRGLARGLGAVVRFTHVVEYEPRDRGKVVRAFRYLRR